jgi:hypothetical protein
MKKEVLVRCNKAGKCKIKACIHAFGHTRVMVCDVLPSLFVVPKECKGAKCVPIKRSKPCRSSRGGEKK